MSSSSNDDEIQIDKKKSRKSHSKITKVSCGEDGCLAKPMLLQNLKDHAKAKHGSNQPKIKGQPTVSSMFLGSTNRKRRGPDSGVGTSSNPDIIERLSGISEFMELSAEDVDTNQNALKDKDEDVDRKEIIAAVSEEFDKGSITQECLSKITNFELVFLLQDKLKNVDKLDRKELLCLVSTLCKVDESVQGRDNIATEVEEFTFTAAKELESDRYNWEELDRSEVIIVEKLLDKKPLLAVHLTKAIVVCLSERFEGEEESRSRKSLQVVNEKLEQIVKKVKPNFDVSDCRSDEEIALKSLSAIQATVNIVSDIRNLNKAIEQFEESVGVPKKEVEDGAGVTRIKTVEESLKEARSVKEIVEKIPEFEYRPENLGKEFQCIVCSNTFSYPSELDQDFVGSSMDQKFRYLKRNLGRHLDSFIHKKHAQQEQAKAIISSKEVSRNKAVGLVLGRIVYYVIYKGRPDTDFPLLVYLSATGGSDCGDINHSFRLVSKFLPYLAKALRRRMKKMLGTRLVSTGALPPVNLIADKATHQRETRQLVGCITVNPGGEELLVAILLGIPKCAGGSGEDLCSNILEAAEPFVTAQQICGFTGDGVYKHCDVTSKLEEKLGHHLEYTWDYMHKAALVDTSLRSGKKAWTKKFEWLLRMTAVIGNGVKFIAWGVEWKNFFDLCEQLESEPDSVFKMKRPAKFSETKFADHSHEVYDKFRSNYKALMLTLEQAIEKGRRGSADQKKKKDTAMEIKGRIHNWSFVLSLSMVTDVYKIYRKISCILQRINILPHEKYDCFNSYLSTFKQMIETCDYLDCPCTMFTNPDTSKLEEEGEWRGVVQEVCKWPRLHQDAAIAIENGSYMQVEIGMVKPTEWRTRAGRQAQQDWLDTNVQGVVEKVESRGICLVNFLLDGLKERVYDKEEVTYIENCRRVLDIQSQVKKVREHGAVKISGLHLKSFREVAVFFEPDINVRVDPDELRTQWRLYNKVLEDLLMNKAMGLINMSSLDILRSLIDPKKELYRYIASQYILKSLNTFFSSGIEDVLSIVVRAAVAKGGVESVEESMVSVVEAHTPSSRGILKQERLEDESLVAWNGEDVVHCDPLVREALALYSSQYKMEGNKEGHFIRRSENIKDYIISEAVDTLVKMPVKFPWMVEK